MTHSIYRYPLEITDTQYVAIPYAAHTLSVACVRGELSLYALVDAPDAAIRAEDEGDPTLVHTKTQLRITIVGTGHQIAELPSRFLGTVAMPSGLVWHVFSDESLL